MQTPQTWLGHNATRYHDLNALPHALPHALPYIFSEIFLFLSYLQQVNKLPRVTVNFLKNNSIYVFIDLMVTRRNPLEIAQNHANHRKNVWQRML